MPDVLNYRVGPHPGAQHPWQLTRGSQSEDYNCRCEAGMRGEFFKTVSCFPANNASYIKSTERLMQQRDQPQNLRLDCFFHIDSTWWVLFIIIIFFKQKAFSENTMSCFLQGSQFPIDDDAIFQGLTHVVALGLIYQLPRKACLSVRFIYSSNCGGWGGHRAGCC